MFRIIASATKRSLAFVAILWVVFSLECILQYFGWDLTNMGLVPRETRGLIGIITMPFLHGSIWHLVANSMSLLCVLIILYLEFDDAFHMPEVIFKIIISSGILLWIFGRSGSIHIGASALGYGLIAYTVVAGFMYRRVSLIVYSIALLLFNGGGLLMGIIPLDPRISWEGHLMGAIAGVIVASAGKEPSRSDVDLQRTE